MTILERFKKQPADEQDYDVDYTNFLTKLADTAASVEVESEPGITILSYQIVGMRVKVWVAGGTSGRKYKVTVRLTTMGGRVKEVEILILVRET